MLRTAVGAVRLRQVAIDVQCMRHLSWYSGFICIWCGRRRAFRPSGFCFSHRSCREYGDAVPTGTVRIAQLEFFLEVLAKNRRHVGVELLRGHCGRALRVTRKSAALDETFWTVCDPLSRTVG